METFKMRISIRHIEGAEIAYLYNREAFDMMNITKENFDNSQFIQIGTTISYNEEEYEVKEIKLRMFPETYEMNHSYGVNLYSPTEQADFNCEVLVFVDNVNRSQ